MLQMYNLKDFKLYDGVEVVDGIEPEIYYSKDLVKISVQCQNTRIIKRFELGYQTQFSLKFSGLDTPLLKTELLTLIDFEIDTDISSGFNIHYTFKT